MTISKKVLAISTATVLAVGLLFAQASGMKRGMHGQRGLQFMATTLDLTDAQQQQAKTIFDNARTQAEPIKAQLKQSHDALSAAIKANKSDQELQQLASAQGVLIGQLAGIHAKSMAHFYQLLTPEQKAKADKLHSLMGPRGAGMGPGATGMGPRGAGMRPRG